DFERDGPQPTSVLEGGDIEAFAGVPKAHEVEGGQIASRVVEEHILRTRIRCADRARLGTGVPVIDGGVELDPGIGRGPGGVTDLLPQIAGLERLDGAPAEPRLERPV